MLARDLPDFALFLVLTTDLPNFALFLVLTRDLLGLGLPIDGPFQLVDFALLPVLEPQVQPAVLQSSIKEMKSVSVSFFLHFTSCPTPAFQAFSWPNFELFSGPPSISSVFLAYPSLGELSTVNLIYSSSTVGHS